MSQKHPKDNKEIEKEELTVDLNDPDDYHRRQRLKEIHDTRRHVHKALRKLDSHGARREIDNQHFKLRNAVALYAIELEPLIKQLDDFDTSLPDPLPWDSIGEYTDLLGYQKTKRGSINAHTIVFQRLNKALAEVKPLIEEDDSDEWEV